MHRRPRVEQLENRQLLATYSPLISAGDSTSFTGPSSSLRACIIDANTNADTTETLNLQAGTYGLTIANTNGQENNCQQGDLDITAAKTYTFVGQGANSTTIDAQSIDRVFQITAAATVTFQDLTITGGLASDDGTAGAQPGSTASVGGGILVTAPASVTLNAADLSNNEAMGGQGTNGSFPGGNGGNGMNAFGGGLAMTNGGTLTLTNANVTGNTALSGAGGDGGNGTSGTVGTMGGSGGSDGSAEGGGLDLNNVTVTMTGGSIGNNVAEAGGGGSGGQGGNATANGTAVVRAGGGGSGGDAVGNAEGGGVYAVASPFTDTIGSIVNNKATGGWGGNGGAGGAATGLTGNQGSVMGGSGGDGRDAKGLASGGGFYFSGSATLTLQGFSLVSANVAEGGSGGDGGRGGDASGDATGTNSTITSGAGGSGGSTGHGARALECQNS